MKFYFFKRNRKEIVPVEDTEINKRAKKNWMKSLKMHPNTMFLENF